MSSSSWIWGIQKSKSTQKKTIKTNGFGGNGYSTRPVSINSYSQTVLGQCNGLEVKKTQ